MADSRSPHWRQPGRCVFSAAWAAATTALFANPASAALTRSDTWSALSQDGKHLLVMVQPKAFAADGDSEKGRRLKRTYRQSGLYRNDGTATPLWTVPYHPEVYDVYVSTDGDHVALVCPDSRHTISQIPVGAHILIYHRTAPPTSLGEERLNRGWWTKRLICLNANSYIFNEWKEVRFDPASDELSLDMTLGERTIVNIRTGDIVRQWSLVDVGAAATLAAVPLAVWRLRRRGCSLRHNQLGELSQPWRISILGVLLLVAATAISFSLLRSGLYLPLSILGAMAIGGIAAKALGRRESSWRLGVALGAYGGFAGLVLNAILEPCYRVNGAGQGFLLGPLVLVTIGAAAGGAWAALLARTGSVSLTPATPTAASVRAPS